MHARSCQQYVNMFILAALLALGFICNLLIRPVGPKNYMTPAQIAAADAAEKAHDGGSSASAAGPGAGEPQATWLIPIAWLAVWIPLCWGVWVTLQKAVLLFK